MSERRRIDYKHHADAIHSFGEDGGCTARVALVKTTNGQEIPEHEPTVLFRARPPRFDATGDV